MTNKVTILFLFLIIFFSYGCSKDSTKIITTSKSTDNRNIVQTGMIVETKNIQSEDKVNEINIDTNVLGYSYSKDNNNVYFNLEIIKGADPYTFRLFDKFRLIDKFRYSKDKNNVYLFEYEVPEIINNANPDTFEVFDYQEECRGVYGAKCYGKDNTNVYLNTSIIPGANPITFKILGNGFSKDNNNVFIDKTKIQNADTSSFEVLTDGYGYAKDKNSVFMIMNDGKVDTLKGVDINSFVVLGDGYSKDKNNIYYAYVHGGGGDSLLVRDNNVIIKGADINSFEVLKKGEAKDMNNKYLYGKIIK